MGIVNSYIKPFDIGLVNATRYIDKILIVGAISNILMIASKCILYVSALFLKLHYRSEFLTYLEGRTFKECRGWITNRKEMIDDREGPRTYDRMILCLGNPYKNLSIFKEITKEEIGKEMEFVENTLLDEELDNLPENWEKHVADEDLFVRYGDGVKIEKEDTYYTYEGKIAIGFHGTYDPPEDMGDD